MLLIEECPFIDNIIKKLGLFTEINYKLNTRNYNEFDLNYLCNVMII